MQHEDWIYINCTITDDTGIGGVKLHLWNVTSNTWSNTTSLSHTTENYYEVNKTGLSNHKYSFDIYAYDTAEIVNHINYSWNKTVFNNATGRETRRYVTLKNDYDNIDYEIYYLDEVYYYDTKSMSSKDRLYYDQGTGTTDNDTGMLSTTMPGSAIKGRECTQAIEYFFNDSICISNTELENIYFHFWWNTTSGNIKAIASRTREGHVGGVPPSYYSDTISNSRSHIDDISYHGTHDYYLSTKMKELSVTDFNFTDNSIYELLIGVTTTPETYNPLVISNRSIISFVILNVPDNATLNSTGDTDDDGLSDWTELYTTYTNPFVTDTDNDGYNDSVENTAGTDPNNYTDYPPTGIVTCYQHIYTWTGSQDDGLNWGEWDADPGEQTVPDAAGSGITFIKAAETIGLDGTATISWNGGTFSNNSNSIDITSNIKYVYGTGTTPQNVASWSYTGIEGTSKELTVPADSTFWVWYQIQTIPMGIPYGEYTQTFTWTST